jgi:hypothetical protein
MSIDFTGLLGQAGITAAQYEMLERAKEAAADIPQQVRGGVTDVAGMASPYTQFKPFTVTTGSGASTTLGPEGLSMQMSPEQQQFSSMLQQQAIQQAQQAGNVTPESLMQQMSALRQPEQERAQLGLENRLAAQGRLGVQTAAYGGTPEQLAMQKAIQEQQSADALSAISGSRQLQQQDLGLAQGMLGLSYMPENQALSALSPALQSQQIGAGLNQTQANLIGQLGQQYLGEIGSAGRTGANLSQAQANMLIQNLLGSGGGSSSGGSSGIGGLIGQGIDYFTGSGGNNQDSVNDAIRYISGFGNGTNALDVFGIGTPDVGNTGMFSTGAGTTPFDVTSFVGDTGVYDPEADPFGLLGGGI